MYGLCGIILILFALHTNLQYKLNRPELSRSESGHISDSGIITHGTVSYITDFVGVFLFTHE